MDNNFLIACENNKYKTLYKFINADTPIAIFNKGLYIASKYGYPNVISKIVEIVRAVSTDIFLDYDKPLYTACLHNYTNTALLLITLGATIWKNGLLSYMEKDFITIKFKPPDFQDKKILYVKLTITTIHLEYLLKKRVNYDGSFMYIIRDVQDNMDKYSIFLYQALQDKYLADSIMEY